MINFTEIMTNKRHLTFVVSGKFSVDFPVLKMLFPFWGNFESIILFSERSKLDLYQFFFPSIKIGSSLESISNGVVVCNSKQKFNKNNIIVSNDKRSNFNSSKDLVEAITNLINLFDLRRGENYKIPKIKYTGEETIYFISNPLTKLSLKRKNKVFYDIADFSLDFIKNTISKAKMIYCDDDEIIYILKALMLNVEKYSLVNTLKG